MKTNQFFFATICMFLFGSLTQIQAQKINIWKGGTPGQTTNWNCPKNWSANQVPDAFQTVIVPDVTTGSGFYPCINEEGPEVNALVLESGASLTITRDGALEVIALMEEFGSCATKVEGSLNLPKKVYAGEMKLVQTNEGWAFSGN
ncbi:MAG: hypothetical protein GC192_20050 [Bacteroidetes bacterium]|nr:hypothetical protein [Bacteroidota bacterium]